MTRREFVKAGAATGLASALVSEALTAGSAPPRPLRLLILGGTGFTGPHQVRYALSRGHHVTLFNRGRRPQDWPGAVEELTGDRDKGELKALEGWEWDVCIDNPTTLPFWVRDTGRVLAGKIKHFVFISTLSVYADTWRPGMDETTPTAVYSGPDAMRETMASRAGRHAFVRSAEGVVRERSQKRFPGITTPSCVRP